MSVTRMYVQQQKRVSYQLNKLPPTTPQTSRNVVTRKLVLEFITLSKYQI